MKTLYVEPFSGISGNMFMGALFDLGASFAEVKTELAKLNLGEYKLIYEKADKCGIHATHFDVELPEHAEHHHEHEHEHHHKHRNLKDITTIIDGSTIADPIKEQAKNIFTELAKAEAKVHGKTIEEIHFHEVGAIDTIIDIVGTLLALENLHITKIYTGKLQTGHGFVNCAHGLMPIPAPATAELLTALPNYAGPLDKELVTPTGAVLLRVLATPMSEKPKNFNAEKIGYGAGTWDLPIPNVLRLYLGTEENKEDKQDGLVVGECNIDDTTGEILGHALEQVLGAGALDAWLTPIMMKKGRPAEKFSFLCSKDLLPKIEPIVFANTTTLGIRYTEVKRTALERKIITVALGNLEIRMKCGYYQGHLVNMAPEYEDCLKAATTLKKPLKEIMHQVIGAARVKLHG